MADYDFDAMRYHRNHVQRSIERNWFDPGCFDFSQTPQGTEFWSKRVSGPLDKEAIDILHCMEELYAELRVAHKMAGYE